VNSGKKTYKPDWRPTKRVKNKKAAKADPRCRICGKTGSLTKHHLVPRGQSGDDVPPTS
jgi:ribosomal protein S14